jgi:tetratricopeptide (TPR) repeat protein
MNMTQGESRKAEFDKLDMLLREDPQNPMLLLRSAELAIELKDYVLALDRSGAALRVAPGDAQAMFHRASALMGLGRFAEAAECLALLQSHGLTNLGVLSNRALCLYAISDFAGANPLLNELLQDGDMRVDTLRLAVSTRHHLGDIEAAVTLADSHPDAAAMDGATAGVYALAYLDAGRASDAGQFADLALASNAGSIDGLIVRATLALLEMNDGTAAPLFQQVLEKAPDNGRAWIGLGSIALLRQDLPRAIQLLGHGVEVMPNHVGSWHVLGWSHLVSGNLDEAERVFRHALELERNFAETHGALATVHALRGRIAEAKSEIALAERLDRTGLAARLAAAIVIGQAGNPSGARSIIGEGIKSLIPKVGSRAGRVLAESARRSARSHH